METDRLDQSVVKVGMDVKVVSHYAMYNGEKTMKLAIQCIMVAYHTKFGVILI